MKIIKDIYKLFKKSPEELLPSDFTSAKSEVLTAATHYHWDTGTVERLGTYFTTSEFESPGTNSQKISKELIHKLDILRKRLGMPITVTSGYRSQEYQDDLTRRGYKTAKRSQHLFGNAADIVVKHPAGTPLATIVATNEILYTIAQTEFKAIGIGKTFLHVDTRSDKQRRWYY